MRLVVNPVVVVVELGRDGLTREDDAGIARNGAVGEDLRGGEIEEQVECIVRLAIMVEIAHQQTGVAFAVVGAINEAEAARSAFAHHRALSDLPVAVPIVLYSGGVAGVSEVVELAAALLVAVVDVPQRQV